MQKGAVVCIGAPPAAASPADYVLSDFFKMIQEGGMLQKFQRGAVLLEGFVRFFKMIQEGGKLQKLQRGAVALTDASLAAVSLKKVRLCFLTKEVEKSWDSSYYVKIG